MPHLLSEKVQRLYYVTRPRFPLVGLGISCPILYMNPSVTQLKRFMLLTFSFYTSFGRRLISSLWPNQLSRQWSEDGCRKPVFEVWDAAPL